MRKKNKEVAEVAAVPMCPIRDVSNYWAQASIELLNDGLRKARQSGNLELFRECKRRLHNLHKI